MLLGNLKVLRAEIRVAIILAGRPVMIKADPNVVRFRRVRILYLACVSPIALLAVATYQISGPSFLFWLELIAALVLIPLAIFSTTLQGRVWKRFEQRRNRAAQGDQSLLAEDQPIPNAAALPLPFTIQSPVTSERMLSLGGRAMLVGLVVAVAFCIPFVVLDLGLRAFRPGTLLFVEAGFVIMIMFLFAMAAMIRAARTRQVVEVTEQGMTTRHFGKEIHGVAWDEARLFAIEGFSSLNRPWLPSMYQLASDNDVVRWQRMGRLDGRRTFTGAAGISYEEYEWQMRALLSLVAAKTGLALYDLRDDGQRGGPKE
jgi:uncharacterized membrane protein